MVQRIASRMTVFLIVVCSVASAVVAQVPQAGRQATGRQGARQQGARQQGTSPTQARPTAGQAEARQQGPTVPSWIPLEPAHEKYLNEVLNFWEHKTTSIKRYRCNFQRHEYELVRRTTATNETAYDFIRKTYTEGKIQYASPDKGLFKAEVVKHRTPPKQPGGPEEWVDQVGGPLEHWVCDGQSIFDFNYSLKQLIVRPLPPEMKGKQITEGPLPFMFGAKAEQIKRRFWVHVVTPPNVKREYHLEAIPRTLQDARNFRALRIIISEADFLPKAMLMFHRNNSKTTFEFKDRDVNWNTTLADWTIFKRAFFAPTLPGRDWKKVVVAVEGADKPAPAPPQNATTARPPFGPARQAQARRDRRSSR